MSPAADDDDHFDDLGPAESDTEQAESKAGDDSSEDDSESDDEDHHRKVSVKDLLDDILRKIKNGKLDLTNKEDYINFTNGDGELLAAGTGDQRVPTALHIMATMDKKELPKLDSKMQPLIEFLASRRDYLKIQDRSGHTSLSLAIEAKKEKMVQWMCDAHPDISSILSIPSNDLMNCLHVGVDKRVKFLDLLVDRADPLTLAAKDANGNTPLHIAVEYKKCRREQLTIIERIVNKSDQAILEGPPLGDFNKEGMSPYLHHKETKQKAREREKRKAREESEREKGSSRRPNPGNADEPNRETRPDQRGNMSSSGSRVHGPDPGVPDGRLNQQLDSRTKYGGRPVPNPSGLNSPIITTAPSLPLPEEKKKSSRSTESEKKEGADSSHKSSSKVDETTVKAVERFLKLHYLRSRSYGVAMEILYGRNTTSEQELYFDLSGDVNSGTITQAGLENLLSKLKFEDILQYVAIPKLSVQANRAGERSGSRRSAKPDGAGRRDLCYVFDRLRKKGVKTILKVFIDDSSMPAHSDEAIEDALKSMDVEVWDWNKTDLCTEVIYKVAPKARGVHLYWSGNNAVLRGWSEEGGLKKLRSLKTVHLHIQQGLESSSRTQQNVKEFLERMKRLMPDVDVFKDGPVVRRGIADVSTTRAEDQTEHSNKHEWIQCMKEFRRLLFDAERYYDRGKIEESIEEPIKIALIDDGVDIKDLEYSFIGGRTFCKRDPEHNLNDPYYVSSTGHGTIMAKQIHLLCPRAQFYVLRLEDHPSDESARQITAKSAAQAILAAVRKKVHIISMSWTIDPPEDEEERRALENAITKAASADILMFCSASDQGAKHVATYPSKATPKIFTIGAATASGTVDSWVGNINNISFTFPGTKVELDGGPTDTAVKEVTGSSVATALAAGLAALILYCVQVRILLATDPVEKQKARRDFQSLQKHESMMRAFKDIGTTEESNHKFIAVWEVFGKRVEEKERVDQEDWVNLIAKVGTTLCMKV
ncbi:Peptidase-S8 domain-containing protein [Fusarium keratoplasticum]|uniref:Peptidase-S8 domain-containing protein n=1 Tax=Fusarium keratoplasticum TaxID=1328300 RepID=A0ACC0R922_9HYPO|nr:Peptidase-S8 domain-containing protein [Fusarium keratoplasticum]KAI8675461.1 Peptidase-S8 domain-containing protein [Fusarium keratoplasticum]KAI8681908.1 Peptidase-S8 domain-containing protein [Fusarium keratoplasticum]